MIKNNRCRVLIRIDVNGGVVSNVKITHGRFANLVTMNVNTDSCNINEYDRLINFYDNHNKNKAMKDNLVESRKPTDKK